MVFFSYALRTMPAFSEGKTIGLVLPGLVFSVPLLKSIQCCTTTQCLLCISYMQRMYAYMHLASLFTVCCFAG